MISTLLSAGERGPVAGPGHRALGGWGLPGCWEKRLTGSLESVCGHLTD